MKDKELLKVILVHGVATDEVMEEAEMWSEDMMYTAECYMNDDYLMTLVTSKPLKIVKDNYEDTDIIMALMDNADKIVSIVLYNYPPGKAEIGASYLDVFQSTYDLIFKSGYKSETNATFSNIDFSEFK